MLLDLNAHRASSSVRKLHSATSERSRRRGTRCLAFSTKALVVAIQGVAGFALRLAKWGSGVSLHGTNVEPFRSALGQKQTFSNVRRMSALPPKADIGTQLLNVRFVPKADIVAPPVRICPYHGTSDMP